MIKNRNEKRQYVLTPISASSYANEVSLTRGFSKFANLSKKGIVAVISILALLTVMFVSSVQTSKPAYADLISDGFCNNSIKTLYGTYGNGFVPATATVVDASNTLLRSASTAATTNANFPLTAYEEYGFSFMNYTSWISATTDSTLSTDALKFHKYTNYNPSTQTYTWNSEATIATPEGKISATEHPSYWSNGLWDCTNASGAVVNGIANTYLSVSKFGVGIINTIYLMVFGGSNLAFKAVYNGIDGLVSGLKDSFFMPYLELMVLLGAVWMAYQGLIKRRSTEALQGAIWMICAAAAGTLLIANPLLIPNLTNTVVTTVNKSINDAITANPMSTATESNALCSLPTSSGKTNGTYTIDDAIAGKNIYTSDTTLEQQMGDITALSSTTRQTECMIWYNVLYTPWVSGQFGMTPPATSAADNSSKLYVKNTPLGKSLVDGIPVYLGSKVVSQDSLTWSLLQLDSQKAMTGVLTGGVDYYNSISSATAVSQLVDNNNGTWTGRGINMERPSAAFASIFAMLGTGILVVAYGLEMIAYQLGMLFLIILMPIFLLIGVHPGMGRRVALRWAELIGNLAIKQVLIGILLSVFLMIYGLVLGSGLWLVQNILIIAVTIVALAYKKTIMGMFANVQLGGSKVLDDPMNQIITGGKRVAGAVVGAGVAAGAAAVGMGGIGVAAGGGIASAIGGSGAGAAAGGAVAPEAAGAAGAAIEGAAGASAGAAAAATPTAAAPASQTAVAPSKSSADAARVRQLKAETMKKAIWMGASQGFASGNIANTAFTSAQLGIQIGDNAYDNEVAYQENLSDDAAREQERQLREANQQAQAEANAKKQEDIKAQAQRKREMEEEQLRLLKDIRDNLGGNTPNSK